MLVNPLWRPNNGGVVYPDHIAVNSASVDTAPPLLGLGSPASLVTAVNNYSNITDGSIANGTGSVLQMSNLYNSGANRRNGIVMSVSANSNATGSIQLNYQGSSKGTISANAGTDAILVVDYGLKVTESLTLGYVAKTANYTADNTNYLIDCTANTFTVTLPTAVGITGRVYIIKNSGTGSITVATTSSQTIDGAASATLATQYDCLHVMSNGANWIVLKKI